MKQKNTDPPKWAVRFLSWYCRPEKLEDLQGDLNEYFQRHVAAKGLWRARLIYAADVLKFFRLYTVRRPSLMSTVSHWMMVASYVKTSRRSIVRNKLFSGINIIGLAISMSVGLLVVAMLSDFTSYDDFHENKDRIFRVGANYKDAEQRVIELASTTLLAGKTMQESIPDVDKVVMISQGFDADVDTGNGIFPVSGIYASEDLFNVFSFPLLQGNLLTALKEPYSIVLSEKEAKRLFGTTDGLGKNIKIDSTNYTVTAIARNIPHLSHIRFDVAVSLTSIDKVKRGDPYSWANVWSNYVFILLKNPHHLPLVQAGMDKIAAAENKNIQHVSITLFLQPFKEIVLGKTLSNQLGMTIKPLVLWIIGGLAFVIILSACFNYTNLSIARAFRRSREVGIRKVNGASRSHVVYQFVVESIIISLLALILAIPLFFFLKFQFLTVDRHVAEMMSLDFSPKLLVLFIVFALAIGFLAGFAPALFFGRINALQVLKNIGTLTVFRRVTMRKVLIVAQYVISLIFISITIIGYDQYKGFLVFNLGFKTENVLNLKMQGNNADRLSKVFENLPEVTNVSRSLMITSLGSVHGTNMTYRNDSMMVLMNIIDEKYLPLHGHTILAGESFKRQTKETLEHEIIVNEETLKRFDIAKRDPQKAIGEIVTVDRKKLTIVGVVKNFHYGTVEKAIEPVMFRYAAEPGGYMNIKINTNDLPATMEKIKSAWKSIDSVHPFDAEFYDDQIALAYSQFSVMLKVVGFIGFLAIVISSMGLFGMVVFTAETRLKEMSIRKVLGASELKLMFLLSGGFILLLAIATFIALPATWLFFEKIVLVNFAYHSPISLAGMLVGPVVVIAFAFLTICSQTLSVARTNPATILKNE